MTFLFSSSLSPLSRLYEVILTKGERQDEQNSDSSRHFSKPREKT